MEVILLEDVKSLGKKGDLVKVNDGYGRNYILPKKLGMEATAKNLNELKLKKQNEERMAQKKLDDAKAYAAMLAEKEVVTYIKTGEKGRSFGSVSSKEIVAEAKKQCGLDIDKKKVQLDENIKSPGVYQVKVKLHPQVTGELKVKVLQA